MLEGDGVHPNSQGDEFIAKQVGPKLIQFIKDVQGGSGGSSSTSAPGTTSFITSTTATRTSAATTSTSAPPSANCASMWGQCGGKDWAGATCCAQGTCKFSNDYYSQCV